MKKLTQALLLFLLPMVMISQTTQFEYSLGKAYKSVMSLEDKYFYRDGEILAVKIDNMDVTLVKFDTEALVKKKSKLYRDFPDDWVVEHIGELNNRYYIFYAHWDKARKKEQLFYREINFETGLFVGKGILLVEADGKVKGTYSGITGRAGMVTANKYDFQTSYDSTRFLVKYCKSPSKTNSAKNSDVIGIHVFDENLNELWSREEAMPYTEKSTEYLDCAVDSDGIVTLLTYVFDDNSGKVKMVKGSPNYRLELLRTEPEKSKFKKIPIRFNDKLIVDIKMNKAANDELIIGGYYNYGDDLENANGLFVVKQKKEDEKPEVHFYDFSLEIANKNRDKKTRKENEKPGNKPSINNLILREINDDSDGSLVLVGEQAYTKQGPKTFNDYAEDILVTKILPNDELAWMQKLVKRQWGIFGYELSLSYHQLDFEGNRYFLFLDHIDNLKLADTDEPEKHHDGYGGYLTCYQVNNATGEVSKFSIVDVRELKGAVVAPFSNKYSVRTLDNEIIYEFGLPNNMKKLLRIEVK